jgi:hypothetical protein
MADKTFGPERDIEELGISPTFELEEARRELKEPNERLEEAIARRQAIEKQRREKRKELSRLRRGSVIADHGDDEGDELEDLLVWRPDLWRR